MRLRRPEALPRPSRIRVRAWAAYPGDAPQPCIILATASKTACCPYQHSKGTLLEAVEGTQPRRSLPSGAAAKGRLGEPPESRRLSAHQSGAAAAQRSRAQRSRNCAPAPRTSADSQLRSPFIASPRAGAAGAPPSSSSQIHRRFGARRSSRRTRLLFRRRPRCWSRGCLY